MKRRLHTLAIARRLAGSETFGYFDRPGRGRARCEPSALAEVARVVVALRRLPGAGLAELAAALRQLPESPFATRGAGLREQLAALAVQFPDLWRKGEVRDLEDMHYVLAWLQRLWKAARAPSPSRQPAEPAPRQQVEPEPDPRWAKLQQFKKNWR